MKFCGWLHVRATPLAAVVAAALALPAHADVTIVVNSKDDIYAAGGNSSAAAAGGIAPVAISVNGGSTLTFGATGRIVLGRGHPSNDADGVGAGQSSSPNAGAGSISGINAPNAGYLVGVFVPTGGPTGPTPARLDFTGAGGTSFTSLSPKLDQVFFIGDGLTGDGTGARQSFIAPSGASLLYLGISDSCNFSTPGCYGDNSGSFPVNVSGADITIANLQGSWQAALIWSGSVCGPMTGLLNFTFGTNGTTSTATLVMHTSQCGDLSSTQSFAVETLKPNGSGTAHLTCSQGVGCGWEFVIQVGLAAARFNLVDVDPANPGNFVEGTAIKQQPAPAQ